MKVEYDIPIVEELAKCINEAKAKNIKIRYVTLNRFEWAELHTVHTKIMEEQDWQRADTVMFMGVRIRKEI